MNRRDFIRFCVYLVGYAAMPWPVFPAEKAAITTKNWERIPLTTKRMRELGVPGGDGFQYVQAIAYSLSNPLIVYLSTDKSGVWRSDNGGRNWSPKFKGFFSYGARSIAVDPLNHNVVLAAGFLGFSREEAALYPDRCQGIYLTIDGGESWRMVRKTDFYKQVSLGCLFAFDVDGEKKTGRGRSRRMWCASANEGLLESRDGGESWRKAGFEDTSIHALMLLPSRPGELLLASVNGLYIYRAGAVKKIGQGLSTFPRSIAVSPAKPEAVFAALGPNGVAKSADGGQNFNPPVKQRGRFFGEMDVTEIMVSPVDGNRVYSRSNISVEPPYVSPDGGKTWNAPRKVDPEGMLGKPGFYFSSPFAPHPTNPKKCLHITNGSARIICTEDGGETWHFSGSGFTGAQMSDILFLSPNRMIFCLTDHGLWETNDNGRTFSELDVPCTRGLKSISGGAASGKHIVVGVGSWELKSLAVSHDGGRNFKAYTDLVDTFFFAAFHPRIAGLVYAGPYVSDNFGHTWRRLPETVRAMSPDGNSLYALASKGKEKTMLLVSHDDGVSFISDMEFDFPLQAARQLIATPLNTLMIATSRGVYRIEKGRAEIRDYRHGLARDHFGTMFVQCVECDPLDPNIVFAGRRALGYGNGNGIFMSNDNGQSWKNYNINLSQGMTVFSVRVNPYDGSVYIGTLFGTFRLERRQDWDTAV